MVVKYDEKLKPTYLKATHAVVPQSCLKRTI